MPVTPHCVIESNDKTPVLASCNPHFDYMNIWMHVKAVWAANGAAQIINPW